ncbi:MAG: hypothetical protein DPW14_10540 [Planctomycetes bacterium]|nr:hypothetical protein [Planctomycetota bacterium]
MGTLLPQVENELRAALEARRQRNELLTPDQLNAQQRRFRELFGPDVLASLDGEALLHKMHARGRADSLRYWLEYKNDQEFRGRWFGSISGGSMHKFGLGVRKSGDWVTGPLKVVTKAQAVRIAGQQRDQLMACVGLLEAFPTLGNDDEYEKLQANVRKAAPEVSHLAWVHKYLSLLFPEKLDDFHNKDWQRFHLFKLLQAPPDKKGIYTCAGRFVRLAAELGLSVNHFDSACNERHGEPVQYWRIGATPGEEGNESIWPEMRAGKYAAIGWPDLGDLSKLLEEKDYRAMIRANLEATYNYTMKGIVTRKAGEIADFAKAISEGDIVLACDGQTVHGIGEVFGAYYFDDSEPKRAPHRRRVDWLSVAEWKIPVTEGPRTSVFKLGKYAENRLEIERQLLGLIGTAPGHPEVRRQARKLEVEGEFDPDNSSDARKRTMRAVACRQGQPEFRAALLEAYGGCCAITGCNVPDALEAAHIRPYRGEHTHHPQNGLLLRADLHTLFDLGYIRIDPETRCVVLSPNLAGTQYSVLEGAPILEPKVRSHRASSKALKLHFEDSNATKP